MADATVEVAADTDKFTAELTAELRRSAATAGAAFDAGMRQHARVTASNTARQVGKRLRDERGRFVAAGKDSGRAFGEGLEGEAAGAGASRAARQAAKKLRGERGRFADAGKDSGRVFAEGFDAEAARGMLGGTLRTAVTGLTSALGPLSVAVKAVAFATLAGQAAAAAGAIVQLGAALAPAYGVLAAYPGVILAIKTAVGVARLALIGFKDAAQAAWEQDPKKFAEALEKLSPAAQRVAREFKALVPSLQQLQRAAQDAFFRQLDGELKRVAGTLRGVLKAGLDSVAGALGGAGREVARFAASGKAVGNFASIFSSITNGIDNLSTAIKPVLTGLLDVSEVGARFGASLTPGIASAATEFGKWLTHMAESGKAWDAMQSGLETLKQIGQIAGNLIGIFKAVGTAAKAAGTEPLVIFGQVTGALEAFLKSAEGQRVLVDIFAALRDIGAAVAPVIVSVAKAAGELAPHIAAIATAVGPAAVAAIDAIAGALVAAAPGLETFARALAEGITTLAQSGALEAIGEAIGALLRALAPVLPMVGALAASLGKQLAVAITQLTPHLVDIAQAAGPAVVEVLKALAGAVVAAAPGIKAFAVALAKGITALAQSGALEAIGDAIGSILEAVAPLLPVVGELAGLLGVILAGAAKNLASLLMPLVQAFSDALLPVLPQLTSAMRDLFAAQEPVYRALGEEMGKALAQIIPEFLKLVPVIIDELVPAFIEFLREITPFIPTFFKLATETTKLVPALIWLAQTAVQLTSAFFSLKDLPGKIVMGLTSMAITVKDKLIGALNSAKEVARNAMSGILTTISELPGRIASLGGKMLEAGKKLLGKLVDGLKGAGGVALDLASHIVQAIRSFFNSAISAIERAINSIPGLPDIRLPRFADGGIIDRPTVGLVGEAGREVIVPLTRPRRAVELAQRSGLVDLLAARGAFGRGPAPDSGGGRAVPAELHVHTPVSDPELVAEIVMRRLRAQLVEAVV
ncbi:phage tail protein [Bailinhaonella thermotolerans]|nr:hypothetical protein [Bailinhaonella thermotolerans]